MPKTVAIALWSFASIVLVLLLLILWRSPFWAKLAYDKRVWRYAWRRTKRWIREYLREEICVFGGTMLIAIWQTSGDVVTRIAAGVIAGFGAFVIGAVILMIYHVTRAPAALYDRQDAIRRKTREASRARAEIVRMNHEAVLVSIQKSHQTVVDLLKAQLQSAEGQLETIRNSEPTIALKVLQENSIVYLEVRNSGASADFHVMLTASGFNNWPEKEVWGRWDLTEEPFRRIARGTAGRLRLATMIVSNGVMSWRGHLVTHVGYQTRDSIRSTFYGGNPAADEWNCSLNFEVIGNPDINGGPKSGTVQLHGSGHVSATS